MLVRFYFKKKIDLIIQVKRYFPRWDIRKIEKPMERIFLDPIKTQPGQLDRAAAISALDSDPSIATKYMAGTEQGILFTCKVDGIVLKYVQFEFIFQFKVTEKAKQLMRKLHQRSNVTMEPFVL